MDLFFIQLACVLFSANNISVDRLIICSQCLLQTWKQPIVAQRIMSFWGQLSRSDIPWLPTAEFHCLDAAIRYLLFASFVEQWFTLVQYNFILIKFLVILIQISYYSVDLEGQDFNIYFDGHNIICNYGYNICKNLNLFL